MKKLISILLVAMLIIGMFPATALTAFAVDTVVEFTFGANGSTSHYDGTEKTTHSLTVDGYTLSLTGGSKMYTGARDAKGNSCIKLGTGSAAGKFSFTVPDDVASVVIYAAKYKSNTSKIKIGSTTYTLTKNSNDGAYDEITVDTSSTKTVNLTTVSGGYRAMINTIVFVIPAAEGSCEHANWEWQGAADATCTTDGYEGDKFCLDCETVFLKGKVIPATNHPNKESNNDAIEKDCETEGFTDSYYCPDCDTTIDAVSTGFGDHSYVDGVCETCGEAQPAQETVTITFDANKTQRTEFSTAKQVWTNDGVTFTNNKGTGNNVADYGNPVRLYQNSELVIAAPGEIAQIVFDCNSNEYATALKNSIGDAATASNDKVTVILDGTSDTFTVAKLTAQVRMDALTVTYNTGASTEPEAPACEHTETVAIGEAKAASCTETGMTAGEKCTNPDCAKVLEEQKVIPALGHNYENGKCSRCGEEADVFVLTDLEDVKEGDIVIITMAKGDVVYAMSNNNGTDSAPTAVAVTVDNGTVATTEETILWNVVSSADGYMFYPNGQTAKYLYCTNTNNGVRVGTGDAKHFNIDDTGYLMTSETTDDRYIGVYNNADWRCYKLNNNAIADNIKGQTLAFYKYEAAAEEPPVVEMDGVQYGSFEEAYQQDPDTPIKLLAPLENVAVTGDLYLDLNGFVADVDNANAVYAYDSTATATTAGTGKLTTTAPVIIDNTVNGVRYIALKEKATRSTESTYTFHVLELNLTHVTLRASEEGLYYKAAIQCDEVLAAATEYHGLVVSIKNMPGADFASLDEKEDNNGWTKIAGAPEDGKLTSCSVFGIFKPGRSDNAARGEQKIYANAYIQLKDEEKTILVADTKNVDKQAGVGYSLRDVMEALNATFPTLDLNDAKQAEQRKTILDFYKAWPTAMQNWNIDNIKNAAQ